MASSARIDELRKKFDENPRRYFAPLANEYRKAGDLGQAIFICQEYLPQQPGHMSGHIVYGQALYEMGRPEEAQLVFETALSLDPENLIALRHLGDIARQAKDTNAARIWYQRVLEADPRNEEIAQIMISLLASPEPIAEESAPPAVSTTAPTPLSTPAVPAPSTSGQSSGAPESVAAAGPPPLSLDNERSPEPRARFSTPAYDGAYTPFAPSAPTPAANEEPYAESPYAESPDTASGDEEMLDLNDFNIDEKPGVSTEPAQDSAPQSIAPIGAPSGLPVAEPFHQTGAHADDVYSAQHEAEPEDADAARTDRESVEAYHVEAHHAEPESISATSSPVESTDDFELEPPPVPVAAPLSELKPAEPGTFDLGHEDAPFEADPLAIAAVSPLSTIEVGAGLELENDEAPPPRTAEIEGARAEGLETFDFRAVNPGAPDVSEPLETVPVDGGNFLSEHSAPPAPETHAEADGDVRHAQPFAFSNGEAPAAERSPYSDSVATSDEPARAEPSAIEPEAAPEQGHDEAAEHAHEADHGTPHAADTATDTVAANAAADDSFDGRLGEQSHDLMADDPYADFAPRLHEPVVTATVVTTVTTVTSDIVDAADIAGGAALPSLDVVHDDPFATPPASAESIPATRPEAFVTETMAELYLRQGHLESALEIYDRLVEQRPGDDALRDRRRAVDDRVHGRPAAPEFHEPESPPAPVYGGPTIRDFLRGLVARHEPAPQPEASIDHSASSRWTDPAEPQMMESVTPVGNVEEAAAWVESVEVVQSIDQDDALDHSADDSQQQSTSDEKIRNSFETLFIGVEASGGADTDSVEHTADQTDGATAHQDAERAPAGAAPEPQVELPPAPLHGLPAHRASSELSLDHVFKGNTAPRENNDGFSFDRFFANEPSQSPAKQTNDARHPPAATDDIAQFNAWLSGLKKT